MIGGLIMFAIGCSLTLIAFRLGEMWRLAQRPPSKAEVLDLRRALSAWACKYEQAKPSGKYLKRREAELFEACAKVGLMWIAPEGSNLKGSEEK